VTSAVSAEGLVCTWGRVRAVDVGLLDLGPGVTALVGVNGAGKTTLLSTLAGGNPPERGTVRIHGADLYSSRSRREGLRKVALVPQLPVFPGNLTAVEVVSYLAWMRGARASRASKRALEALERVGLADRARSKVRTLSGGMLRRVALAQAIAGDAEVLLLDEPSTGLDPQQRHIVVELIKDLPGTVLVSSHIMEDVADLASRVLVMDRGEVRFDGTTAELADRAPAGAAEHRRLEAGFLSVCLTGLAP